MSRIAGMTPRRNALGIGIAAAVCFLHLCSFVSSQSILTYPSLSLSSGVDRSLAHFRSLLPLPPSVLKRSHNHVNRLYQKEHV